jgi:hypothetical protein
MNILRSLIIKRTNSLYKIDNKVSYNHLSLYLCSCVHNGNTWKDSKYNINKSIKEGTSENKGSKVKFQESPPPNKKSSRSNTPTHLFLRSKLAIWDVEVYEELQKIGKTLSFDDAISLNKVY